MSEQNPGAMHVGLVSPPVTGTRTRLWRGQPSAGHPPARPVWFRRRWAPRTRDSQAKTVTKPTSLYNNATPTTKPFHPFYLFTQTKHQPLRISP
jgi:hypothetical protein